jgi:hypothetical protein
MDAVTAQHEGWKSWLYWYTDLNKAIKAAKAADKPILSLRPKIHEFLTSPERPTRSALLERAGLSRGVPLAAG